MSFLVLFYISQVYSKNLNLFYHKKKKSLSLQEFLSGYEHYVIMWLYTKSSKNI